jgi:hypothetical protein
LRPLPSRKIGIVVGIDVRGKVCAPLRNLFIPGHAFREFVVLSCLSMYVVAAHSDLVDQ